MLHTCQELQSRAKRRAHLRLVFAESRPRSADRPRFAVVSVGRLHPCSRKAEASRRHRRLRVCDRFARTVRQGDGVAALPPRNPAKSCAPCRVPSVDTAVGAPAAGRPTVADRA
jgi:hypothetical protein